MKKFAIICLPFLLAGAVHADLDSGIFGSEKMADPQKERSRPFNVCFSADNVCQSHFSGKKFNCETQSYFEAEAELGGVFYYTPCYEEGAKLTAGYTYARFDWDENPFFKQKRFNIATAELGFATKRVRGWLWQANVAVNTDLNHFRDTKYVNADLLLWGRYCWSRCIGFHSGFLAYTGMHVNKVWPVFGFDWTINRKWKINAVYPLNISVVYQFNRCWAASLAGRAFINRYRAGPKEPVPEAIFEYRNTGAELALTYDCGCRLKMNVHVGRTFNGSIRISNENHHHGRTLFIDGACYYGGNLDYSF